MLMRRNRALDLISEMDEHEWVVISLPGGRPEEVEAAVASVMDFLHTTPEATLAVTRGQGRTPDTYALEVNGEELFTVPWAVFNALPTQAAGQEWEIVKMHMGDPIPGTLALKGGKAWSRPKPRS